MTAGAAGAAARLEALLALSEAADGAGAPDAVLAAALDRIVPAVADLCLVEDAGGAVLGARAADGLAGVLAARPLGVGPREPAVLAGDEVARALGDDAAALGLRAAVVAPLRAGGRALGTLVLAARAPLGPDDRRIADATARLLAGVLAGGRGPELAPELRQLVDNMDDAVNVRDLDGRIVLANAASAALLHAVGPGELEGAALPELWSRFALFDDGGRELGDEDLPWHRVLRGETHVEPLLMRRVVRAGGRQQWLVTRATPIRDAAGQLSMVMSMTEDVTAARRAEIGRRLLLDAGRLLSRSLDVTAALQEVAELAVPTLADWCGIDLPGTRGTIEPHAVAHVDPERVAGARELRRRHPVALHGPSGLAAVLHTGAPLRVDGITDAMLEAEATDATHLALLRAVGLTSVLGVPLRAGEEILGVLLLGATQPQRRFDDHDLELAEALASRIGEALRNARLFRERDAVAHALSAGLAPDQAPQMPGCTVALRYRPAAGGLEAGGDFYEVVDTPAGVVLVIGDVAGKGATAAALSAVSRVTLRTAVRLTGDPRAALDELNHVLRRRSSLSLCTVGAVALPTELPGTASVLLAGHPPPLLVRDGACRPVGRCGPLLGAVEAADWPVEEITLQAGETLLLYTDGVLDAALPGGERFGEARLRALVDATGGDPDALVAAIDAALSELRLRDDVAVVAVRCAGVVPLLARGTLDGEAEHVLAATFPGGRDAPAAARDAVAAALAGRVHGTLLSDAVLVASELVTNAVRHGGAPTPAEPIEVHAALVGDGMRLEVVDPGPGFDPGAHGPRPDGGHGLLLLDRLAARWGVAGSGPTVVWSDLE